jgi:ribosomal protein S18 acetylase RimI-like enzyme
MKEVTISKYAQRDYTALKQLYQTSGWFDPETDSEERIRTQIEQDENAILLARDDEQLVGTVTLLFAIRLGLFFRLVTQETEHAADIRSKLLTKGEEIFKEKGYNEVHIIAPESDTERQEEYEQYGFKKGAEYRWFWKKLDDV